MWLISSSTAIMNTIPTKTSSSNADRKTIEKNRRNHMKLLYTQLNSLVNQDSSSSRGLTLPEQISEAAEYIKKLQENVANLSEKKECLLAANKSLISRSNISKKTSYSLNSPVQIEVHEKGSTPKSFEVVLVTSFECQFVFTEAIRILHEEYTEVINASYSVVGSTVFHSIHAQLREDATTNNGVARITERLKKFSL